MMRSKICLSAETLKQLSSGELAPATVREIETHIDECSRCRELLALGSDSRWNDEICPVLRADEHETYLPSNGLEEDQDPQSLDSVLRLLGPTDDPHMLGRIGAYEVVSIVGRGGMGIVFKAFDATLNRFVAIKMLLPHLATSGAARKRFAREGRAAAAVIDDNVMPIYNVDQWQGTPYLVTQYSRGSTLQQRIQEQGPLAVNEILRIAMQTARGLEAAHAQGLVHRDIKPSNILLDGSVDRAMLTDFGLARAVDDASITRTGTISGTPQYMSPEQARGGSVDSRSDLFGLGCVMYAMCTGRPPFRADNSYAVLRLIADEDPRPIQEINPDIPAWLCSIISRLMAKEAGERFADAGEVAELLEACLAHLQQPAKHDLPLVFTRAPEDKPVSKLGRRWALAGLAFISVLAGALWLNELNHGKLIIECTAENVPIRITQGDTVIESMTVTKRGATVRVAAGKYRIEVDGDHREFNIDNNSVMLSRGGIESVKITLEKDSANAILGVEKALSQFDQRLQGQTYSIAENSPLLNPRVTVMGNGPVSPLQVKSLQMAGKRSLVTIERRGYDGLELGCKVQLKRNDADDLNEVTFDAKIIHLSDGEAIGKLISFPKGVVEEASPLIACDPDVLPFNEKCVNGTVLVDLRLDKSSGDTIFKSREIVKRVLEIGGERVRIAIWPQAIRSSFAVLDNNATNNATETRLAIMQYLREQNAIRLVESNFFRVRYDSTRERIFELDTRNDIEVHPAYLSNDQSTDHAGWRHFGWTNSENESKGLDVDLRKNPLIGAADIASFGLLNTAGSLHGNYAIEIKLKPEAVKRLAARTAGLVKENGKVHLAVFVNESFTFAARLITPISTEDILIPGRFNKEQAEILKSEFGDLEYAQKHRHASESNQDRDMRFWAPSSETERQVDSAVLNSSHVAPTFDSPEACMEYFSECSKRNYLAGSLACYSDSFVTKTYAIPYLKMATAMERKLINECNGPRTSDPKRRLRQLNRLKELQSILNEAFADDAVRNTSNRTGQAEDVEKAMDKGSPPFDPLVNDSIRDRPRFDGSIPDNPRLFVEQFYPFLVDDAGTSDKKSDQPNPYRIVRNGTNALVYFENGNVGMELVFANGTWWIDNLIANQPLDLTGQSESFELQEQVTAEESKINDVFRRYSRMAEQRNWKEVLNCWTDDCRDEMILELIMGAELIAVYSDQIDNQVGDRANEKFLGGKQFLFKLKEQFPALGNSKPGNKSDKEALEKQLTSLDPDVRRKARISAVQNYTGIDRDKLIISLIDFMSRIEGSDFNGQQPSKLVDIDVRDSNASAIIVSKEGLERSPVTFKKTEAGWKIDRLVNNSVMDQMTELHREIEGINSMIADDAADEMRKAGASEAEIEAMREEIRSQTRPPAGDGNESSKKRPIDSKH